MKTLILTSIMCALMAAPALAVPTLDTLIAGEPAIAPSGAGLVILNDLGGGGISSSMSVLSLENAGFESSFGLYNPADISKKLTLFTASAEPPAAATEVQFNTVTGVATVTSSLHNPALLGTSETIGTTFGFWINANESGTIYYSEKALNPGGLDHGLIYDPMPANYVYAAFEDLPGLGDMDWDDFVVRVDDVSPFPAPGEVIPAPGAILLGSLGAGIVGCLKRRKEFC